MTTQIEHAELIGGPFDGKIVEFVAIRYEHAVARSEWQAPEDWLKAVYEWEMRGEKVVGVFKGLVPI